MISDQVQPYDLVSHFATIIQRVWLFYFVSCWYLLSRSALDMVWRLLRDSPKWYCPWYLENQYLIPRLWAAGFSSELILWQTPKLLRQFVGVNQKPEPHVSGWAVDAELYVVVSCIHEQAGLMQQNLARSEKNFDLVVFDLKNAHHLKFYTTQRKSYLDR